jgi:hypothetical protein
MYFLFSGKGKDDIHFARSLLVLSIQIAPALRFPYGLSSCFSHFSDAADDDAVGEADGSGNGSIVVVSILSSRLRGRNGRRV